MKSLLKKVFIASFVVGVFLSPLKFSLIERVSEQHFVSKQTESSVFYSLEVSKKEVYAQIDPNNITDKSKLSVVCIGWVPIPCQVGNFLLWYFQLFWYTTTAFLAGIMGQILDIILFHSISSPTYRTGIIETGWEILRNFVNIIFIFSLLTLAFKTIFGGKDSKTKKYLIKTILVALVINFSLFLSYIVIDSSNILGQVFYSRINVENNQNNPLPGSEFKSPSNAIVGNFSPQTIISETKADKGFFDRWLIVFGAGLINILMIWLFLKISLSFVSRTVGLMLSTILSPAAFATVSLPFSSAINLPFVGFSKWLNQLISLSFMAPIYLFFLFLIVTFAKNDSLFSAIGAGSVDAGTTGKLLNVFLPFIIIAALLFMTQKVVNSMSGDLGKIISENAVKLLGAGVVAVGITGAGAAGALGLSSRAIGKGAKLASKLGDGKRANQVHRIGTGFSNLGKSLMSTRFDVTKIPGVNDYLLKKNPLLAAAAKKTAFNSADVEHGVKNLATGVRVWGMDTVNGTTPPSAQAWQDKEDARKKKIKEAKERGAKIKTDRNIQDGEFDIYDEEYDVNTGHVFATRVEDIKKHINDLKSELENKSNFDKEKEKNDFNKKVEDLKNRIKEQRKIEQEKIKEQEKLEKLEIESKKNNQDKEIESKKNNQDKEIESKKNNQDKEIDLQEQERERKNAQIISQQQKVKKMENEIKEHEAAMKSMGDAIKKDEEDWKEELKNWKEENKKRKKNGEDPLPEPNNRAMVARNNLRKQGIKSRVDKINQIYSRRSAVSEDINNLENEVNNDIPNRIKDIKNQTTQDIADIKNQTTQDIADIKNQTTQDIADIKDQTTQDIADIKDQAANEVEVLNESLNKLYKSQEYTLEKRISKLQKKYDEEVRNRT